MCWWSRAYLDGAALTHTRRQYASTAHHDTAPAQDTLGSTEGRTAHWTDQSHLVVSAAAGWHTFDLRMSMEAVDRTLSFSRLFPGVPAAGYTHRLYTRVSFGLRNVRVLRIL